MKRIIQTLFLIIVGAAAAFAQDPPPAPVVEEVRSTLVVVSFGEVGAVPLSASAAALDSVAPLFRQFPNRRYELHGYFCPAPDSNGAARAAGERVRAVGNYLVANGVPTGSIIAVKAGYAEAGSCACVAVVAVDARQGAVPEPFEVEFVSAAVDVELTVAAAPDSAVAEPQPAPAPGKPTLAIYAAGVEPPAAKGVQREQKKVAFLASAISLDALGVVALMYGLLQEGSVAKHVDLGDYPKAERAVPRRNAAYIISGTLMAYGVALHISF